MCKGKSVKMRSKNAKQLLNVKSSYQCGRSLKVTEVIMLIVEVSIEALSSDGF